MSDFVETPRFGGLTAQEERYSLEFVRTRNQRAAYRAAFDCSRISSVTLGKRAQDMHNRADVQERISGLIAVAAAPTVASVSWVLERLTQIATADPNELMPLKVGACRYCHGLDHGYHWKLREYEEACASADRANEHECRVAALTGGVPKDHPYPDPAGGLDYDHTAPPHPDCPECRGEGVMRIVPRDTEELSPAARALFAGVKQTANGIEIKMADQTRALELLGKIIGAFKDDSPKTLQVEMRGLLAAVRTEAKDPQEAARMYQDMIAGRTPK